MNTSMKRIAIFLAAAALLLAGQTAKAQIWIGVGAGSRGYFMQDEGHAAPQLSLEGDYTLKLGSNFSASAGLSLTGVAGYHFAGDNSKNLGEIYLDIPIRGKFQIPLFHSFDVYLFAGPTVSVNLVSIDAHSGASTNNYQSYPTLNRLDVMLGGGAGAVIAKHIRIGIGYDYGLLDRDSAAGTTIHTGALKVTAGYIF